MRPWRASVSLLAAAAFALPAATASGQAAGARSAQTPKPAGSSRPSEDKGQPVTVDADRMERFGKESLVVFSGNVVARQNGSVQHADRMEVYLDDKGDRILRTVSTGNVRIITKDCKTGTARRAEYFDLEQRMVLIGNARVWQDDNVVSGETITIYSSQDRSIVEGGKQERVKAVFYQKDQDQKDKEARDGTRVARTTATACAN
jgi:lipopolysaccharide export system protein LptA